MGEDRNPSNHFISMQITLSYVIHIRYRECTHLGCRKDPRQPL